MLLELITEIIPEFIGKLYLMIRYRSREDREKALAAMQDTPGSYIAYKLIRLSGIVFLLLILISLMVTIFATIRSAIQ